MKATQTPQEAFTEAADIAQGYFAQPDTDEAGFARAFGWELLHTGGGVMVAIKATDAHHVIGVTTEVTCLYHVADDDDLLSPADVFLAAEDPWLISANDDAGYSADVARAKAEGYDWS